MREQGISMAETGLPTRILGRTGLTVTRLGYGTLELRHTGEEGARLTDEEAGRLLNAVLDEGINFVDTAPDYGAAEGLIGRYLALRRDEYFLTSKVGCLIEGVDPTGAVVNPGGVLAHLFTEENIVAGIHQSLRRLRTDHLDIVQFHGNPSLEELEQRGALAALDRFRESGEVRFVGASAQLPQLPSFVESGMFDVLQIPYSAIQREHEDLITEAARLGAGTIIRGGTARGSAAPDKDWSVSVFGVADPARPRRLWEKGGLDDLLEGGTRMEFMLRFTLSHPDLHTAIVGTSKVEHLQENLAALRRGPLPEDIYQEARQRLDRAMTLSRQDD